MTTEIQEEMLDYIKLILSRSAESIDVYKETLHRWPDSQYNIYKITAKFNNDWTIKISLSGIYGAPLETIEVYYKHIRAGGLRFDFEADDKHWTRLKDYYKKSVNEKLENAIQKMESHWYDDRVNHELYPNGLPDGVKAPAIKSFRETFEEAISSLTNPYRVTPAGSAVNVNIGDKKNNNENKKNKNGHELNFAKILKDEIDELQENAELC